LLFVKKKILILIDWFTPGYKAGGPIQSCVNLCRALRSNYDIYVLTTDTDHGENEPYAGIVTNKWIKNAAMDIQLFYAEKKSWNFSELKSVLNKLDAEYVYLNMLFSPLFVLAPLWLKFRNAINSKVILCPRGSLYESALNLKWYKKMPVLLLYKWLGIPGKITFHATNLREEQAIIKYFPHAKVLLADNLPDANQQEFETCVKTAGRIKCIFVARIVPIKNLGFILKVLGEIKAAVNLSIVGPVENEMYWKECNNLAAQLSSNIKVEYLGSKQKDDLPALIKQHHLFILPTLGENFGHAIFEAMLCGRPVLISDQTPWLQLDHQNAGWDISLSAPEKFAAVIENLASCNQEVFDSHAKAAWQYANNFIENSIAKQQYFKLFS